MKKRAKPKPKPRRIVALGTMTRWGRVAAISHIHGERYYFCVGRGCVSLMPAVTLEGSK